MLETVVLEWTQSHLNRDDVFLCPRDIAEGMLAVEVSGVFETERDLKIRMSNFETHSIRGCVHDGEIQIAYRCG